VTVEESPNVAVVRRIRRQIRPATIEVVDRKGQVRKLGTGGAKFPQARIVRNLDAVDWEQLTCLDADGNVIDTILPPQPTEEGEPEEPGADPVAQQFSAAANHLDRMMRHITADRKQIFETMLAAFQSTVTENIELRTMVQEAFQWMREAALTIQGQPESQMTAKDKAMLTALGGLAEKFELIKPGTTASVIGAGDNGQVRAQLPPGSGDA
jgi:hypothetical protein